MNKHELINSFSRLGELMNSLGENKPHSLGLPCDNLSYEQFNLAIEREIFHNGWFTEELVRLSLCNLANWLNEKTLENWLSNYPIAETNKTIAVIMAGNIPLVGFHDFICVLFAGYKIQVKLSSDDNRLFRFIYQALLDIDPRFENKIQLADGKLASFDAVIATGGSASLLHFQSYFSKVPHIFRGNRSSVAILTGKETNEELCALGEDIFLYFGRGCRNVSHLLLPKGFLLNTFFEQIISYSDVINNKKYGNNYDYHKTIHLMNLENFLDNNFVLMKESEALHAPIGMIYYHYYEDPAEITSYLEIHQEEIQCIVGNDYQAFGSSQQPQIDDYADNMNTMDWLHNLGYN
ncbi:MAG: acyl-CoA reductase [Crocinitomicaceae bacterium]|nr:acyl-CoA reductase [Crocinitomicaceae bacterium]